VSPNTSRVPLTRLAASPLATLSPQAGRGNRYAASALAGFSGGVIAPDILIASMSLAL
jgi:hypothetical protein